jgi:hypothetical protein
MEVDLGANAVNEARDPVHGATASAGLPVQQYLQPSTASLQHRQAFVFKRAWMSCYPEATKNMSQPATLQKR